VTVCVTGALTINGRVQNYGGVAAHLNVGRRGAFEAKRCNRKSPNGYTPIEKKYERARGNHSRALVIFAGNPGRL
jgi:hypothetical protein